MKDGFTLIELLAVILILGIVSLIAFPVVNEIVEDSRKSSFKETNNSLVSAINDACNVKQLKNEDVSGTYYISNGKVEGIDLNIKGKLPNSGYVSIDSNCNVALATFNNDYCATKELVDDKVIVADYSEESGTCSINSQIITPVNVTSSNTCFLYTDNIENSVTITGYDYNNPSCSKSLVIPTTIDNKKVTKIEDFAFTNTDKIVVDYVDKNSSYYTQEFLENYTGLRDEVYVYHFLNNSTITGRSCYKIIDDSTTTVPIDYVHTSSDGYDSCIFTTTATSWSDRSYNKYAFNSIDLSKAIYLSEVPNGLIVGAGLNSINLGNYVTKIGKNAFADNNISGTLNITNNIKEIGAAAFLYNDISNVDMSSDLSFIGYGAFLQNKITSLEIKNPLIEMDIFSFSDNLISSVTFPVGIKKIGRTNFYSNLLTSIEIPNTVEVIEVGAFGNNLIESLEIPSSVKTIEDGAFDGNNISSLSLGTGVNYIGDGVFYGNDLVNLVLPNNLTYVGVSAFYGNKIKNLTIGTGLNKISTGTFYQNVIDNIVIPDNIKTIEEYAFSHNYSKTVNLGNGVSIIQNYAFNNNNFTSLSIPNSVTSVGAVSFRGNAKYLSSLTIGNSVQTIGNSAFTNNKLTTLNIPNNVKSIGNTSFANGDLTSVFVGNGITSISTTAFNQNANLTSITIDRLLNSVTGMPWGATAATVSWTGTS